MVSGAFVLVWSYADSHYIICCLYTNDTISQLKLWESSSHSSHMLHAHTWTMHRSLNKRWKTSRTYTITKSWRPILLLRRCILNRVDRFGFSLAHRDLFKRLYNVSDFLSQLTNLLIQLSKQQRSKSAWVSSIILHWLPLRLIIHDVAACWSRWTRWTNFNINK